MSTAIPLFRPKLPPVDEVAPYLRGMDQRRTYTNQGPLVRELEQRYADFLGVQQDRVVAVSSGTAGLIAAVLSVGVDHWLVPDWTFAATPLAVLRAGKSVTFRDVQLDTCVIEAEIDSNVDSTDALLPVMPFGTFAPSQALMVQDRVVLDAAASIVNARGKLDRLADASAVVFSLHATKILGCGEGGLLVCGSHDLALKVRSIINFGFDDERESVRSGFNGKMSEISAAYALAALDGADDEVHLWHSQCERARTAATQLPLEILSPQPGEISPYWIMRWPEQTSNMPASLASDLAAMGVASRRWWPRPCSSMPAFAHEATTSPNALWLSQNTIGLPFFIDMSPKQFSRVASTLNTLLG